MSTSALSRRRFLQGSGAIAGSSVWPGGITALFALGQSACSARDSGETFLVLSTAEARELEAVAARIMPTTDTPGAREAGVIHFIDQAADTFLADDLARFRADLAMVLTDVQESFPGSERFSDLSEADQDKFLLTIEDTAFFDDARFLTLAGFFAMSKYGGNRDDIGWKLIGMDPHQHAWQPPFGYYDAEYEQGAQDGD
jgi:gluconate 2-dehydrogenase gamma chain